MRFTAIVGTIDEVDILPAQIEHLRRIGVDHIIVIDHGSTDGTLEYIAEAEAAGDIWLVREPQGAAHGDPAPVIGRRPRVKAELARSSDADWVFVLDSDEFWLPATGSLRDLADLGDADILSVMRYNVVLGPDGPQMPAPMSPGRYGEAFVHAQPIPDFYAFMTENPAARWTEGLLEPKVMFRPEAIAALHAGDHDIDMTAVRDWRRAVASDVIVAHVPFRTLEAFARRAENVRQAIARKPSVFVGSRGWQWRIWAAALEDGRLEEEFERQRLGRAELRAAQSAGSVRSVAEIFEGDLPAIESEDAYDAARRGAQPWLSAAGRICRTHDIQSRRRLEYLPGTARPTVIVAQERDRLVRFYHRWRDGLEAWERERAALELVERDPTLAVERLIAHGTLSEDWRFLVVTRVPGRPRAAFGDGIPFEQHDEIAAWLGRLVRQLRDVPVDDHRLEDDADQARTALTRRYDELARRPLMPGLPGGSQASTLGDWLPSLADLLGSPEERVLTHGSLDADHVYVRLDPVRQRHHGTGVVGFEAAAIGHPLLELGPVWWSTLGRDSRLMASFLGAADLPGWKDEAFPKRALAWAMLHPATGPAGWPAVEDLATLDDLAARSFGAATVPAQAVPVETVPSA